MSCEWQRPTQSDQAFPVCSVNSTVVIDIVCGDQRPQSYYANMQADLYLHCHEYVLRAFIA